LRPTVGIERQSYASAMAGLWGRLSRVLARLESIASRPDEELADEHVIESMPALQYALHTASELALGIDPPMGSEWAHHELASALEDARDATAEVSEAAEHGGPEAAAALVHEWRGALFRVRLAQMRLARTPLEAPAPVPPATRHEDRAALVATSLVLLGTFVVTCGAVVGLWPVWAAGIALVAAGFFVYRP
jgi:hypothetical protein